MTAPIYRQLRPAFADNDAWFCGMCLAFLGQLTQDGRTVLQPTCFVCVSLDTEPHWCQLERANARIRELEALISNGLGAPKRKFKPLAESDDPAKRRLTAIAEEAHLSKAEFRVFMAIVGGESYQHYADQLKRSLSTIQLHATAIYAKLRVRDRWAFNDYIEHHLAEAKAADLTSVFGDLDMSGAAE